MEKVNCQSYKQEIPIIKPYVQLNCPECVKPYLRRKFTILLVTFTNVNVDFKRP